MCRPRAFLALVPALLVMAILSPALVSAQPRIAYVTSWRIIGPEAEFQGSKDAEQALNRDVESWNRELEEKKQGIIALEKEIEQKRLLISDSKRQELEQKRTQMAGEYERRVKEVYGDGGLVERRNFELTKSILDKVKEAVSAIAREDGYDFVFDASDANLVWANKQFDITERVLAKMAELAGTTGTGAAAAPPPTPPVNPNPGGQR